MSGVDDGALVVGLPPVAAAVGCSVSFLVVGDAVCVPVVGLSVYPEVGIGEEMAV